MTVRTLVVAAMLSITAGAAQAQALDPNLIDTTRGDAYGDDSINGTDLLNKVMDDLLWSLAQAGQLRGGINRHAGYGSSSAERQLEGSPRSSEGACTPIDSNGGPELNPGCQEIAPMSRPLQSSVCEDDPNPGNNVNTEAEGLAFCAEVVVVTTNNDSLGAFGDSEAACAAFHASPVTDNTNNIFINRGVGRLRTSGTLSTGYVIGANLGPGNEWKDVLRLIYTGCANIDGSCSGKNRLIRCDSAERREIIDNWGKLFEGQPCPQSGGCGTGLRHAYRSGVLDSFFLSMIGVSYNASARLGIVDALAANIRPVPTDYAFCDGGEYEGFWPTHLGPETNQFPSGEPLYDRGDPIRKPCAPEDDLCGPDGKLGVVRPILSARYVTEQPFPEYQCKRLFAYQQFINTALPVCPDRTKPSAGRCKFPYYENGGFKTFQCVSPARAIDAKAVPGTDGRAYNYVLHQQDGVVFFESVWQNGAQRFPHVASYRQNMVKLDNGPLANGKAFSSSDFVCTQPDRHPLMGCLTASTKCSLAVGYRESAFSANETFHLYNDPIPVGGFEPTNAEITDARYPMTSFMFLNAIRGFENIMRDCVDRGGREAYCEDQARIAREMYGVGQPGNLMNEICPSSGYVALDHAVCVGAQESAGCGAPTVQPQEACQPQADSYASQLPNRDNPGSGGAGGGGAGGGGAGGGGAGGGGSNGGGGYP